MPAPDGPASGSGNSATRVTAGVDPIDWIHRIPIEETREYVQKVLSNIQIYRARLGETNAVRLNADLKRISTAPTTKASAAATAEN